MFVKMGFPASGHLSMKYLLVNCMTARMSFLPEETWVFFEEEQASIKVEATISKPKLVSFIILFLFIGIFSILVGLKPDAFFVMISGLKTGAIAKSSFNKRTIYGLKPDAFFVMISGLKTGAIAKSSFNKRTIYGLKPGPYFRHCLQA